MASIEDVAKMAGVSKALVSRYINGRKGVGPENRKRIQESIDKLNYRRNDIARSLVQQRTEAIGIILDEICTPFNRELIHGLEAGGQETGYSIIFCDCRSDLKTKLRYTNFLSHNRVDGLVLYGSFKSDNQVVGELDRSGFPYVLIENDVRDVTANKVLVDNRGGIRRLIHHFYTKGYRDFGFFCWGMDSYAGRERYQGFLEGLEECGLKKTEDHIYNLEGLCPLKEVSAYVDNLITAGSLPRVLMFGADEQAFQAIRAFRRCGVRVPEDVALTGFDHDYYLSRDELMPRLYTLEQPLYEMGRAAIRMLVESIENPQSPTQTITFSVQLIPGETG